MSQVPKDVFSAFLKEQIDCLAAANTEIKERVIELHRKYCSGPPGGVCEDFFIDMFSLAFMEALFDRAEARMRNKKGHLN